MSVGNDLASLERKLALIDGPAAFARGARKPEPLFARAVAAATERIVRTEARKRQMDPALLLAVARVESAFDPAATSAAGAVGLMQLMPGTARALGVENSYDPEQNVRGGATYLRGLLDRFGGDISAAVAAYNAGPSAVERYGGPPPFPETQRYVARVLAAYRSYRSL